jgi:hypothetical protein
LTTGAATKSEIRASRWQRVRFWSVRISVSILLPLLVAEGILRLIYRDEEASSGYWGVGAFVADERLGYRHAPGFEGYAARRGEFYVPVAINAQGLRQKNLDEQLRYPRRLLLLGASYVFGLGVAEEDGFASLIQDDLNAEGVGVVNASQSGYSVEKAMIFGLSWAARVAPETILLTMVPTHDSMAGYRPFGFDSDTVYGCRLPKDRWWPVPAVDYLRTHSYLWQYLATKVHRRTVVRKAAEFRAEARAQPELVIQPTLKTLRELHRFCVARSIVFGVIVVDSEKVPSELDDRYLEACRTEGIPVLRCGAPEFTDQDFFARDAHWNESGHRKTAARVLEFVRGLTGR